MTWVGNPFLGKSRISRPEANLRDPRFLIRRELERGILNQCLVNALCLLGQAVLFDSVSERRSLGLEAGATLGVCLTPTVKTRGNFGSSLLA